MPVEQSSNPLTSDTASPNNNAGVRTGPGTGQVRVNNDVLRRRHARRWSSPDVDNTTFQSTGPKPEGTGFLTVAPEGPNDLGVVTFPTSTRLIPREIKLQEWEGQVQEVGRTYFSARLVDLTADETDETEEVQLPLSDITESDQALLVPGAVFRWMIGYRYIDGVKERFTRVVVRRLPVWTEQEIRSADKEALELYNVLIGDAEERAASTGSG